MRTQPAAHENSPTELVPPVCPKMPWRVAKLQPLSGFRLRVEFVDGLSGTVDMSALVISEHAGVFAALADPAIFAHASVEYGVVTWPGEVDLAPDAMHHAINANGIWVL